MSTGTPGCQSWQPGNFAPARPAQSTTVVKDGQKTPGKVAIFATCYINYNEPGIGLDLLRILDHNEVPYVIVEKEKCCGMPKLELGDLESVNAAKEANIPVLAKYAKRRLCHFGCGAELCADVQAGNSADVPR